MPLTRKIPADNGRRGSATNDDDAPPHRVLAGSEYRGTVMVNNERDGSLFRFNHA
jgi:hypothetical protein